MTKGEKSKDVLNIYKKKLKAMWEEKEDDLMTYMLGLK